MVTSIVSDKDIALQASGMVQFIDWVTSDRFEDQAASILGLLDSDDEPIQDYMSRDSDSYEGERG